jgi:hypothetical protein
MLEVSGQKAIRVWVPRRGTENTIRGRWWIPSSPGCGESCESYESKVARGLS